MFVLIMCIIGFSGQDGVFTEGVYTAICFIIGSFASALSGYVGMLIATQANSRTCEACRTSISRGLEVSFASGAVMGNAVVGLGLLGLSALYLVFSYGYAGSMNVVVVDNGFSVAAGTSSATYSWTLFSGVFNRLAGFGFGASTIGMFARVGGGVFTKVRERGAEKRLKMKSGRAGVLLLVLQGLTIGCWEATLC
jgi:K(+)-stimulated pyrophosphate-energized sodium pump